MHSKMAVGSAIMADNYQMPLFHLQQKKQYHSQTKLTKTLTSLIYINLHKEEITHMILNQIPTKLINHLPLTSVRLTIFH